MKHLSMILLLVMAAVAVFAMLNWGVFITPTELSLGVSQITMPLGLLMLGLLVFVAALSLVYVVYLQASTLLETRRQNRDLRASRELADQAEASRFAELRTYLQGELARQSEAQSSAQTVLLARLDRLEQALRQLAEEETNSIAASVGELEDRLERGGAGRS